MEKEPEAPDAPDVAQERADEPEPRAEVAGEAEPRAEVVVASPRKRRWLRVVGVLFGLLLALAIVLALLAPGLLRARIIEEAHRRGIALSFEEAKVGWSLSMLTLKGVKVTLDSVPDFGVTAPLVEVDLVAFQPTAVRAEQLGLTMSGTEVIGSLGAWKTAHPTALSMPVTGEGARVEWHPVTGVSDAVALEGARVAIAPDKGFIDATSAVVAGRPAGPVKVDWVSPAEGFVIQVRPAAAPLSAIHGEIRSSKDGSRVKLFLDRTPLAPLAAALGVPKGSEGLVADGEVEMPLPSFDRPAAVEGSLRVSVKGYVPPHPRDLDGIVFGDTTTVRSKFVLAEDYSGAQLSSLTVEAGALVLSGSGDVAREGFDARVSVKLKGTIACTALATSAAVSRLGGGLGRLAGAFAAGAVKGSVSVSISAEAKASDLKGAKIHQSARVGCKVTVPGLPQIVFK